MIFLASDHAGFRLKEFVKDFLKGQNRPFEDVGPADYNDQDDFPDFIIPCSERVASEPEKNRGLVFGGSGQGEAIAANKVPGVRAALYYGGNQDIITLSREHNLANMLSLGARFVDPELAKQVISLWLNTPDGIDKRHLRRVIKISNYEKKS